MCSQIWSIFNPESTTTPCASSAHYLPRPHDTLAHHSSMTRSPNASCSSSTKGTQCVTPHCCLHAVPHLNVRILLLCFRLALFLLGIASLHRSTVLLSFTFMLFLSTAALHCSFLFAPPLLLQLFALVPPLGCLSTLCSCSSSFSCSSCHVC